MKNYLQKKAEQHKVTHEFSGRQHFFKVESKSGQEYSVSIQAKCDCKYMGVQGVANGEICSHILAVFENIIKYGNIKASEDSSSMIQAKRNACLNLVRQSNRKLNEIRSSSSESKAHIDKKTEICNKLISDNKHFVCEAIFNNGGRADILVLDDFKAIEIVKTESNESIINKTKEYPEGIKIEVIRCQD